MSLHHNRSRSLQFTLTATASAMISLGAFGSIASAAIFTFDPDGPAPANGPAAISGLDWSVGNSLAANRVPAVVGNGYEQYYQTTLAGVINGNGTTVAPVGLNSTFEITAVARMSQFIDGVTNNSGVTNVHSRLSPGQAQSAFFEIYYDDTPDASNLAGTGFNNGTLIFSGAPLGHRPNSSVFANAATENGAPIVENYDDFGADDYPQIVSLVGSGGMNFETAVDTANANFFISTITTMFFNTSLTTPFRETDPSHLFAGVAGGGASLITPNLGSINGATGPDFQFQADANSTFTGIPEPLSTATSLLCLGGLMLRRRRTR